MARRKMSHKADKGVIVLDPSNVLENTFEDVTPESGKPLDKQTVQKVTVKFNNLVTTCRVVYRYICAGGKGRDRLVAKYVNLFGKRFVIEGTIENVPTWAR